jgi:hypothetical protein
MNSYEFRWIKLNSNEFVRSFVTTIHDFFWICTNHEFIIWIILWLWIIIFEFAWNYTSLCELVWFFVNEYNYMWMSMHSYKFTRIEICEVFLLFEYVWVHVSLCECMWICIRFHCMDCAAGRQCGSVRQCDNAAVYGCVSSSLWQCTLWCARSVRDSVRQCPW